MAPSTPAPPPQKPRPSAHTRFTLRQKLTVSLMTVGLSSLLVAGMVYVSWDLVNRHAALRDRMNEHAEAVGHAWAQGTDLGEDAAAWSLVLLDDPAVVSASILGTDGDVLAEYSRGAEVGHSALSPTARFPIFDGTRLVGTVVVRASARPMRQHLGLHGGVFLTLVGASILMTLGLGRRIHRRFSDHLLDLAHAANAISSRKDYSIRAVRRSDDEIGILVDTFNHMITQIELRDLQLKAEIKRAEAARTAKSQFLATMSHEIRTPINGVLGMTQLLLDTPLSSEQSEFANTIHSSAEGLLSIINDILDFSKGEAGRYELEEIPFTLGKVVEECLDTVAIVAAEKMLELVLEVDPRLPPQFKGDPSRLRQVLLNLLSNALKFTKRGEIVLRILVEEDLGTHVRVRFEVQDTGIGIPHDRVDRLFQSFSQVDASRSRKYGGTGLGLAISKQIVEAMGGTMFVKTEAGVGSTFGFKLQLPVAPSEESRVAPPRSMRILVADPSPTSGKNIAKLLRDDNIVEVVPDVPSARLKLLDSGKAPRPFDLVLLDLRLASALDQLDTIGAEALADLPLIVLAPVNQLSAAAAVPWRNRKAALAKPIKRVDLFWCISELLRGPAPALPGSAARPTPTVPASEARGAEAPAALRVLVAEDHPVNQRITTRFLEKLGASWELAQNGREALEAIKKSAFDLVLMDVQMPVMDGLEATLAIRKLEALHGGHVPIIALTANVLEEHRREAQAAGFDDYLAKPIGLNELRARLEHWGPKGVEASGTGS